jgi:hypothetical protein
MKKEDLSHHAHVSTSASVSPEHASVSLDAIRNLQAIKDAAAEGWAKHGGSISRTKSDPSSMSLLTSGSVSGVSLATSKRR